MKTTNLLVLLFFAFNCYAENIYDYSTPENALTSLETAYKNKDIEAAVMSKSFYYEAEEMLVTRFGKEIATPDLIKETAEILELGFRKEIQNSFPDFSKLECSAKHKK